MELGRSIFIKKVESIDPAYEVTQKDALRWLMGATTRVAKERCPKEQSKADAYARVMNLYEHLLTMTSIRTRRSVLADYTHENWSSMKLFGNKARRNGTTWHSPSLEERMNLYGREAMALVDRAFPVHGAPPSHLLQVSCTGYQSPNVVQRLVVDRGWYDRTKLVNIGHMGCYATLPAVNLAAHLTAARDSATVGERASKFPVASVLPIELCTLHLQLDCHSPDQAITNALFADGAARIDISADPEGGVFEYLDYYERLIPESADQMTWSLSSTGFQMTLNKRVPLTIGRNVKRHVRTFLQDNHVDLDEVGHYVIHPGGSRIIETVQAVLGAKEETVRHAKDVLLARGNMSSATIPHIWERLQGDPDRGRPYVLTMAFGPGLTLVMNLMRQVPS